ncbi:putative ubiquitin hydrolase putativecysteine peptidase Clan CA family C19 [Leptomonas pyrrhocoris]|uniref:Ubiquitin carboxyl-terminal hydrolase n=1 Tax=Leptomonas pyrrhocoris TaxID=157538 RepID=A0A0M9G591_LEPPY|nr:putative ubiquitin hydrolase putativecysteine peptidase Clan CA family C19 [Leptomonas pyrrhocoris]XP_015660976.1 putative ubiquitin hydrolase putativecysteine peptidase Clan CA family C19 [Leptomonas pyrrhocoris]XP_015660977.1 putative ubiquitin hydrolase putativecysteine peptidase Clan CA family C19 [Leptomonas pyrrhocoris]KPA82536.1 putative ubiquitin hydrolase putativecysteine peptidase Clan CA family C19 [Leptomonas pyrrhocoris]KPA82537.1 putative ubiquitin hydrolase putativecysteine pe|eukprot:XP_015660975.1 putative ubiquitin hydrolase putativecysteine peptidase Clan CA family C19 [Leptomonas pyrrhocoris]
MRSGYVGIYNQGSTCYLNSVIQALYHLPAFRTQVFNLPNVESDAVSLALREIFAQLELRNRNITTTDLTKAFGWSAQEAAVQHDVHELMQQLFDSLETALKETPEKNLIRDMFGGLMIYRSKAVDGANYLSDRLEDFYDVELVVRDRTNIEESLQQFSSGEKIDGVSVEVTAGAAPTPHTIERSQHFLDCPKVLLIHPNRVAFDTETYELVTLRNVWSFETKLSLASYLMNDTALKLDKESREKMAKITHRTHLGANYTLRSILTHAGDATIGHYYVYVNFDGEWVRFNDEIVEAATEEDVRKSAFGGQPIQSRYRLFDNERASLLLYVNDDVRDEVLRETPPPQEILDLGRLMEDERTRTLETRKFNYYVCDASIVDVFDGVDGASEKYLKQLTARVPQGKPSGPVLAIALAQELHVAPTQLRLYYRDHAQFHPWSTVESVRNPYDSHYPHLYVDVAPPEAALATPQNTEAVGDVPVLAFLRGVTANCGVDVPVQVVRSIPELRHALPPHCYVYTYRKSAAQPRRITMESDVVTGDNILYYVGEDADVVVAKFIRNRRLIKTRVFLYDDNTGTEKEVLWLRMEESAGYGTLQRTLFKEIGISGAILHKPASPDHIGFFSPETKTSYAFSMPIPDSYAIQQSVYEMTLADLWGRGEQNHKLVMTILPLPLPDIDLSQCIILNSGYKNMPHVYLSRHVEVVTFRLLLRLAVQQLGSQMRESVLSSYTDQLAGKSKAVRLLWVIRGEIKKVVEDEEEEVPLVRHGNLVLDKLSPTLPGYARYDVLFCRRRSGERFFGLPTNIIVKAELSEQGEVVLRRIVKRLGYPNVEEAMKKWILCVMNTTSRKTRTAGMKEVLSDLVKDVCGAPFVFVVDRPQMLLLDGVDEADRHQESIVIKSSSKTDLSAL